MREEVDTVPKPRDQSVGRSELTVVFWMANRRRMERAMTATAQLVYVRNEGPERWER